jgi:hypothetical protein
MATGDIYYSPRANRFYQEGRRGALNRDYAVRNLRYDEQTSTFIDDRGRTISREIMAKATRSVNRFVGHDAEGRAFVTGEASSRAIQPHETSTIPLKSNQVLQVRTVVTTGDGRTHVFYRSMNTGVNVSEAEMRNRGIKHARSVLLKTKDRAGHNYVISTPDLKKRSVRQDFYLTTVKIR